MPFFKLFSRKPVSQPLPTRRRVRLGLESLEDRTTPTTSISGFAYHDANSNGLFDSNESPLGNVQITLKNAAGVTVGTTTTNAQGFYEFTNDNSIPSTPVTVTKEVIFDETDTNFDLTKLVDQFDSAQGQLQSIEITHEGAITSTIKVENTSVNSGSTITGTVSGSLNLKAPGINDTLSLSQNAGNFDAAKYDGALDYAGTAGTPASGINFGSKTATGTKSITLTGGQMSGWIGTGKVTLQEIGAATSTGTGGGNVASLITSTGRAKVTVKYTYTPSNVLQPATYTIHEAQPSSYLDGKESQNGVALPNTVGTDVLTVTLANNNSTSPNNNFGEVKASAIAGYVYHDINNNGLKEVGETAISMVTLVLTGTNDIGQAVNLNTTTDVLGAYSFSNLRPGSYTVAQTQPPAYLDGRDTPGTLGGLTANSAGGVGIPNDQIASIPLPSGAQSNDNNFGEVLTSSLSGFVYLDANDNGIKDGAEAGIQGVVITLNGFTADGPVSLTATTDALGAYSFTNLKPGTYALVEGAVPATYADGKDTIGTPGGQTANDSFSNIILTSGVNGTNNNFGEITPKEDADLGIVKSANLTQVAVGDTLTYTLNVTNYGTFTAKGVKVSDALPTGATYLGGSGAGWTISQSGGIVTATRTDLAVGASSSFTVQIRVPAVANTLTNTGEVTSDTPDNNPNNNKSTVTTPVIVPETPLQPLAVNVPVTYIQSKKDMLSYSTQTNNVAEAAFVAGVFQTILGRPVDQANQNNMAAALANGSMSRAQFTSMVWESDEHRARQVQTIYQNALNRGANASEQAAGIASLRAGTSEAGLTRSLLASAEYNSQNAGTTFVGSLYTEITGKLPTQAQFQATLASMNNSSADAVIQNLQMSDDGLRNLINSAYRGILRRNVSEGEIASLLPSLKSGAVTEASLRQFLLNSNEFYNLAYASRA